MSKFNKLVSSILETTLSNTLGPAGEYNPNDNRPIEPASIILGARKIKKRKAKGMQLHRRNLNQSM
jgi:hypothetical protein